MQVSFAYSKKSSTFTWFPCLGKYNFLLIWQIYVSIICAYQKKAVPLQSKRKLDEQNDRN